MVNRLYVDEYNVKLETTLKRADLSGYTGLDFQIKKPSGDTMTFPLTVEQDGSGTLVVEGSDPRDAIVFYLTEVGDLDEVGVYIQQIELVFANAAYLSDAVNFPVLDRYES